MKIINSSCYTLTLLALEVIGVIGKPPAICVVSPAISIEAGHVSKARIEPGRQCDATLTFQNPDFLPVHYDFKPLKCLGFLEAEIKIPYEVPNGDAYLLWDCAGGVTPTCNHVWISGGWEDPYNIVRDQHGTVACLVPTGTLTSFSTISSPTTATDTLIQTEFSTSDIASISDPQTTLSSSTSSSWGGSVTQTGGNWTSSGRATFPNTSIPTTSDHTTLIQTSSVSEITNTDRTLASDSSGSWLATISPSSASSVATTLAPGSSGDESATSLFSASTSISTSCPITCGYPPLALTSGATS